MDCSFIYGRRATIYLLEMKPTAPVGVRGALDCFEVQASYRIGVGLYPCNRDEAVSFHVSLPAPVEYISRDNSPFLR